VIKRTALMLHIFVFLLTSFLLGTGSAAAQMQMDGKSAQTGPFRSVQKSLQMRQMTTARRKAAAGRNTQRKVAVGQRNKVTQKKSTGVAR